MSLNSEPREEPTPSDSLATAPSAFVANIQQPLDGATNLNAVKLTNLDDITGAIVNAAIRVHKELGPGLLETVYEVVLARILAREGFFVERQCPMSFEFEGLTFTEAFRADLLVERRVIVELKSVEKLAPVHGKQLLTYLRVMKFPVGLLINFGASTLKEGLHRIVNNFIPSESSPLRVNQRPSLR